MYSKRKGITLVEILLVLVAIAFCAMFVISNLQQSAEKKREVAFKKATNILTDSLKNVVALSNDDYRPIRNNNDLAETVLPYLVGSRKDNTITTPDGFSYTFFWRKGSIGTFPHCGGNFSNTQAGWEGSDANCVVVIDTDGIADNINGIDDYTMKTKIIAPSDTDQFPMVISQIGVRPAYYEGSLGYKYMFGVEATEENSKPWLVYPSQKEEEPEDENEDSQEDIPVTYNY